MPKPILVLLLCLMFSACAANDDDDSEHPPDDDDTVLPNDDDTVDDDDTGGDDDNDDDPWTFPEVWMEGLEHPYLIFTADRIPELRERRGREPYATLWARIEQAASRQPLDYDAGDGVHWQSPPFYRNGNLAKTKAFLALIEDDAELAAEALELLLAYPTDVSLLDVYTTDVHLSDGALLMAEAYDLLAATDLVAQADLDAARDRLAALAESMYGFFVEQTPIIMSYYRNNHNTKFAAALGMIGMALADHPDAHRWVGYAISEIDFYLSDLGGEIGAYNEGPYYYMYHQLTVLPFLLAYDRLAETEPQTYWQTCANRSFDDSCEEGPREFGSLLRDPRARRLDEWSLRIRMPDGALPPYDDATLTSLFNGLLAGPLDDGRYAWDWLNLYDEPLRSVHTADLSIDLLAGFDDTVEPMPPDWPPTQFLYEEGNAVLRSDWGPRANYLLLLGEHGPMRKLGHEHSDAGAFMIHAGGEYLAIDSGYIRYDERDKVANAPNHNLILVDGQGPPDTDIAETGGVDAWLSDGIDSACIDFARVTTEYAGAAVERTALMLGDEYFAILDDVRSGDGAEHEYDWLLHGWAGGESGGGFERLPDGAAWTRNEMTIQARIGASRPLQTSSALDIQGLRFGQALTHEVLHARTSASDAAFAAALFPHERMAAPPEIACPPLAEPDRGAVCLVRDPEGEWVDLIGIGLERTGDWLTRTECPPFAAPLCTGFTATARRLAARSATADGRIVTLLLDDATAASVDGWAFETATPITAAVCRDGKRDGWMILGEQWPLHLTLSVPGAVAVEGEAVATYSIGGDTLLIELSGPGQFQVTYED